MRTLLDDETLDRWIAGHEGWSRSGNLIERHFAFPTFLEAVEFVNRVAERAEAADHHPDLDIRYDTVRVGLSTHSAGGITGMDLALAEEIGGLV